MLNYYLRRGKALENVIERIQKLKVKLDDCNDTDELMAIEGNIREYYYKSFNMILDNEHFIFEGRSKRPPLDRLNALISFGNSLLYTYVLSEIYKTHLDPRIGFLHATNFRRFTLNLDVAENFKPIIVDRVIFTLVNKGIIKASHFENLIKGIVLNEKGKKLFIEEMENKLQSTIKYKKTWKTCVLQAID